MGSQFPVIYIARHGETAWTVTGQHTGLTDLRLPLNGENNARALRERLKGIKCAKVLTSPLQRARRTCELAGFGSVAEIDSDLVEWDYREHEGLRSADIRAKRPDWELFRDGAPGGEAPDEVIARADKVWTHLRDVKGKNRAVLHVALRAPRAASILVDGKNVGPGVHEVLDRMADFSNRVRNGARKGYTGKRTRNVINIGIGGSDLGPVMGYEALKAYSERSMAFHFVSNVDSADFAEAVYDLDPAETISKNNPTSVAAVADATR